MSQPRPVQVGSGRSLRGRRSHLKSASRRWGAHWPRPPNCQRVGCRPCKARDGARGGAFGVYTVMRDAVHAWSLSVSTDCPASSSCHAHRLSGQDSRSWVGGSCQLDHTFHCLIAIATGNGAGGKRIPTNQLIGSMLHGVRILVHVRAVALPLRRNAAKKTQKFCKFRLLRLRSLGFRTRSHHEISETLVRLFRSSSRSGAHALLQAACQRVRVFRIGESV